MENLTFGLDIATALSIIAAAIAFLVNTARSNKKERNERHKDIIKKYVFQVADKLYDESMILYSEIEKIENALIEGKTNQDLNPFRDHVQRLHFAFKSRIVPFGTTYGDGRFVLLVKEYTEEMQESIDRVIQLTIGESDERWDFEEVMYKPLTITEKYITKLLEDAETYIETL